MMADTPAAMPQDLSTFSHLLIFGGTFDPPHRAHLELPRLAMQQVGAQTVLYIPAGRSPLKVGRPQTAAEDRLAMLRLALADEPWAILLTDEIDRAAANPDKPSYTVDTLQALRQKLAPGATLRLLMGTDQMLLFSRWHRARRIVELAEPLVMVRPPATRSSLLAQLPAGQPPEIWSSRLLELPAMDVSASDIRARVARGQPLDDLVKPTVENYIRRHRLYQQP